jgi:proteasome lid subunit RPN8/RPN11
MTRFSWKHRTLWILILSWVACMLAMQVALPAAQPVATVTPDAVCHASVREAATAGIRAAAETGWRVEYGGAVFARGPQCFVHTEPVTSNQPSSVEYVIRIAPGRMSLAGIYHTHTPGGHAREFSACDRAEQRRLGVPSYLGILGARSGSLTIRSLGEPE